MTYDESHTPVAQKLLGSYCKYPQAPGPLKGLNGWIEEALNFEFESDRPDDDGPA
jgi:hypothetical protein